jgi:hypothetical protein
MRNKQASSMEKNTKQTERERGHTSQSNIEVPLSSPSLILIIVVTVIK